MTKEMVGRFFLGVALLVWTLSPHGVAAQPTVGSPPADGGGLTLQDPLAWTNGYTLIIADNSTWKEAHATLDLIEQQGGRVADVVSPRVMLGWVSRETDRKLVGKANIVALYRTPVATGTMLQGSAPGSAPDDTERSVVAAFFNEVASGRWAAAKRAVTASSPPQSWPYVDGLPRPAISHADYVRNLEAGGLGVRALAAEGVTVGRNADGSLALSPGNSDFMVGRVLVNYIFVESNGATDPNTHSWTTADRDTIQSEILAAHSFWVSSTAPYRVPLIFFTAFMTPFNNLNVFQPYEPILRGQFEDTLWISAIMCNFGNCVGDKFARTTAFNSARRVAVLTNWSATSFIGYNPSPASTTFTDGFFAYAYLNGPYSQLLFRNNGWAISQYDLVNAHENGHLLGGAADQYASSGCANCLIGGTNGVFNGNCANCNAASVPSIMRNNELAIDGYLPGQIGWAVAILEDSGSLGVFPQNPGGGVGGVPKSNWVPGQAAEYKFCINAPGRPDSLGSNSHVVTYRWKIWFPGNIVQDIGPNMVTITTDSGWCLWTGGVAIPGGAEFGQALAEVQFTIANYGRAAYYAARRIMFILPGGNPVAGSPAAESEPGGAPVPISR